MKLYETVKELRSLYLLGTTSGVDTAENKPRKGFKKTPKGPR